LSDSANCPLLSNYIYKNCKVTKTIRQYCMENIYA